ncbi:hypothetical protein BN59_00897 [Legionella massiliensis]|uniref:Uncharacterized protein n=1 Tax=Legionella massiliensis TaxID=1034943 RepID=A0A078KY06_9GAMM|nr:hypothetical protein BN59_00897 [Legionella massiliensis]CEE12361.1 hypothetical protein BN1094_00897 [Legionella massiliensis]
MKWLSIPFKVDEKSKQLGHNEQQRLQTHSQPPLQKGHERNSLLSRAPKD